ncbi:MAG: hypothetical protein QM731_00390 [Chitinophagaceae bacterium]
MKPLLLAFLLFCVSGAYAQAKGPLRSSFKQQQQLQDHWKELRITPAQRLRLVILLRKRRLQQLQDQKELDEILTPEQKRQLNSWKRQELLQDSTLNN